MIVSQQVTQGDIEEMLLFYKAHFDTVDLVSCMLCGGYLCFELAGPDSMGMSVNELGKIIVPIGDNMLSCRVRLDEAPNGDRMMGYQCGSMVPNPAYQPAMDRWQAEFDKAKAAHEKSVAQYDRDYKKVAKSAGPGEALPAYTPPELKPIAQPRVAPELECGNKTLLAEIEKGLVPTSNSMVHLSPFEKARIHEKIQALGVRANFKQTGNKKYFETFCVERIK